MIHPPQRGASRTRIIGNSKVAKHRIEDIIKVINQSDVTEKFDGESFKTLVERILVKDRNTIEVEFKCGIKETEKM